MNCALLQQCVSVVCVFRFELCSSCFVFQNDKKLNKPKVWIYTDKMSGRPKGEATITYDDQQAAHAAIDWFNGRCSDSATFVLRFENV